MDNGTISIELSEHDAWQLVALIKREQEQSEPAFQPYWEKIAQALTSRIGSFYISQAFNHQYKGER